jgi:hypothetical protein
MYSVHLAMPSMRNVTLLVPVTSDGSAVQFSDPDRVEPL